MLSDNQTKIVYSLNGLTKNHMLFSIETKKQSITVNNYNYKELQL